MRDKRKPAIEVFLGFKRRRLNTLDRRIVRSLVERNEIAAKIAEAKFENDLPVFQPKRHQEVRTLRREWAIEMGGDPERIGAVVDVMLDQSVELQRDVVANLRGDTSVAVSPVSHVGIPFNASTVDV